MLLIRTDVVESDREIIQDRGSTPDSAGRQRALSGRNRGADVDPGASALTAFCSAGWFGYELSIRFEARKWSRSAGSNLTSFSPMRYAGSFPSATNLRIVF